MTLPNKCAECCVTFEDMDDLVFQSRKCPRAECDCGLVAYLTHDAAPMIFRGMFEDATLWMH